jgi:ankyrin repeat protein
MRGHLPVVLALLEANADPAIGRVIDGFTPIAVAAEYGHLDVVNALLGAGADPSAAATDDGQTPVSTAAVKFFVLGEIFDTARIENLGPTFADAVHCESPSSSLLTLSIVKVHHQHVIQSHASQGEEDPHLLSFFS